MKDIFDRLAGWVGSFGAGSAGTVFSLLVLGLLLSTPQRAAGVSYANIGNDRVLLMNDEKRGSKTGVISNQGYYCTNSAAGTTYWTHLPFADANGTAKRTLMQGTNHVLHAADGTVLWTLRDCRAGFIKRTLSKRNFLPVSSRAQSSSGEVASMKIDGKTYYFDENDASACVILRNGADAAIYSPYYEDGVGTIYFDAVNAMTDDTISSIAIQMATNVSELALAVAEEEGRTLTLKDYGDDDENLDWFDIPFDVLPVTAGKLMESEIVRGATNLTLEVTAGSSNDFYRIRAQLNHYGPMRFRIRRTSLGNNWSASKSDTSGLILVDNLIASYPPVTVRLNRRGNDYDPSLKGKDVQGIHGDFSSPFFAFSQDGITAFLSFDWIRNFTNVTQKIEVTNPRLNYRWRYLGQVVGEWQSIALSPEKCTWLGDSSATQLVSAVSLPLTNGVGDVEYFYTVDLSAPYYKPVDYAYYSKSLGFGTGWTEAITSVTNRGSLTNPQLYNAETPTPAGGTDYFVRIREGESLFERVYLSTFLGTNSHAVTNCSMELVSDHTWRYHYHVPTNMAARGETLNFWFCGTNQQVVGESRYRTGNRKDWKLREGVADVPYLPFTSVANGEQVGRIAVDGKSTHLVFEFNDDTGAFTMSHGGYQDFNMWTDAKGDTYVGNYVTTSGVSDVKTLYTCDMTSWPISFGTNSWWSESFGAGDTGGDQYPMDVHFDSRTTPNGWQAGNGMFVSTDRTNLTETLTTDSRALKMDGGGAGFVELTNLSADNIPQGVDTFSFDARVAQDVSFDSFVYSLDNMTEKDCAMSAEVAMSTVKNGTDMSPGTPTVSLVGYYRPKKGCYEFRIRRLTGTGSTGELELSLWKWQQNAAGTGMEAVRMAGGSSVNGNGAIPTSETKNPILTTTAASGTADYKSVNNLLVPTSDTYDYKNWTTCYISVFTANDGTVHVLGAMGKNRNQLSATNATDSAFVYVYCKDASSSALAKGSFGVGSTDCKASFGDLMLHPATSGTKVDFSRSAATPLLESAEDWDDWSSWDGSSTRYSVNDSQLQAGGRKAVIAAIAPSVKVEFLTRKPTADSKDENWETRGVTNVASFNPTRLTFQPRTPDLCYVRLATSGDDDKSLGIVVDNLEVRQWRGETHSRLKNDNYGLDGDWTYVESWIVDAMGGNAVLLQPKRGSGENPVGIRAPLLRQGLSMFSFAYTNADENAVLLLQIATNDVNQSNLKGFTYGTRSLDSNVWTTVKTFDFSEMSALDRRGGTLSHSMSLRAPVSGTMRLIVDPGVVAAAAAEDADIDFGSVTVTSALCYDEPRLDDRSWWGWNMRTAGWTAGKADDYALLTDWSDGLSAALNWSGLPAHNSNGAEFRDDEESQYSQHDPFVQSPPLESGIGNVSIRARKMYGATQDVASVVCLLGASSKDAPDEDWTELATFTVDCPTYQTFTWSTTVDKSPYKVIRLSVPGAAEHKKQRVMIDEVAMYEPISPKIALVNLAPFRTDLDKSDMVITNIMSMDQQPLLGESWGVQVEVEPQQMGDELDMDHVRVLFSYKVGVDNWGIVNWISNTAPAELHRVASTSNLIFRSTYDNTATIVPSIEGQSVVVQYCVTAEYWDKSQDVYTDAPHEHRIEANEWSMPSWYRGKNGDLNVLYGAGLDDKFSPYTILESISPRRAWINEINFYDGCSLSPFQIFGDTNQYVEIAAPAGSDLTGWGLQLVDQGMVEYEFAIFGYNDVASRKTANSTNSYAFLALRSPETASAGHVPNADGTWKPFGGNRGRISYSQTSALRLVRPSGIWEHEIVFGATNIYAGTRVDYLYDSTNLCGKLNAKYPNARFLVAGNDKDGGSLGVFRSHGENGTYPDESWQDVTQCSWTNSMRQTPGTVNVMADGTLQTIDDRYYLRPNGTNVWIYADVSGGHVLQKFGTNLVENAVIVLPMGSSTNIVFVLDRWYEVASISTNGISVDVSTSLTKDAEGNSVFAIRDLKDHVNLVASAGPNKQLRDLEINDTPYRDAIMHWLQGYDDEKGIQPAYYRSISKYLSGDSSDDILLPLEAMYWLNVPPTEGNWLFVGGMGSFDGEVIEEKVQYTDSLTGELATNVVVNVTMMLTNTATDVAYAPNMLQGLEPGSKSYDPGTGYAYDPKTCSNWTSATFKVTGALQNGKVNDRYIPLRWFVFGPDSFDEDFRAKIEILDPFRPDSAAAIEKWGDYKGTQILYKWSIDTRLRPDTTEMLNKRSVFHYQDETP